MQEHSAKYQYLAALVGNYKMLFNLGFFIWRPLSATLSSFTKNFDKSSSLFSQNEVLVINVRIIAKTALIALR